MRLVRSTDIECSLDSIPASLPGVQTLVAGKSLSRSPSLLARVPTTSSARPYIGEESITLPLSLTKSESPSPSSFSLSGFRSTSKTFQVPSPMTVSFSPEDGITRVSIDNDSVGPNKRDPPIGKTKAPLLAPTNLLALRRVNRFILLETINLRW